MYDLAYTPGHGSVLVMEAKENVHALYRPLFVWSALGRDFLSGNQSRHFVDCPDVIRDPGGHRGRDPQRFMNAAEIVVHVVERD
jgi:hypothetical protein